MYDKGKLIETILYYDLLLTIETAMKKILIDPDQIYHLGVTKGIQILNFPHLVILGYISPLFFLIWNLYFLIWGTLLALCSCVWN